VTLFTNPGSSTYHSLQTQLTKRLSYGVTGSTSYTFSRAIGESDTDGSTVTYRDPNNRSLNKALLSYHRTHILTANGTLELPFGANHRFLSGQGGVIERLVEHWQLGGIFQWSSGAPLTVTAPISTITQATAASTPNIVGNFPKSMGTVTKVANGVTYLPNFQQVNDPARASVSAQNGLSGSFSNKAIADANGNYILINPLPGQIGTLGPSWIQGPSFTDLDMNLIKRVKLSESKEFEFRVDAVNVLNHPNFDNPNLNIDGAGFGRITSSTPPNRKFIMNVRLNF
jgi:hypothetical protein